MLCILGDDRDQFTIFSNFTAKRSFDRAVYTYVNLVGLVQFSKMVRCEAGKSALWSYNNYGCWCGKGGSGRVVDATDR